MSNLFARTLLAHEVLDRAPAQGARVINFTIEGLINSIVGVIDRAEEEVDWETLSIKASKDEYIAAIKLEVGVGTK